MGEEDLMSPKNVQSLPFDSPGHHTATSHNVLTCNDANVHHHSSCLDGDGVGTFPPELSKFPQEQEDQPLKMRHQISSGRSVEVPMEAVVLTIIPYH